MKQTLKSLSLKSLFVLALGAVLSSSVFAGGWDREKGTDSVTLKGELICIGCSLKKLSGANAQCGLYTRHDVGFKLGDGTFWNFVNNATGHDIIRAHKTVIHKQATVTGWMYPNAHMIEIESITVEGVTPEEIAKAAWNKGQEVAKQLTHRKVGQPPEVKAHKH
jgi:hypothetical protein